MGHMSQLKQEYRGLMERVVRQSALASEQVQSRFVNFVLKNAPAIDA